MGKTKKKLRVPPVASIEDIKRGYGQKYKLGRLTRSFHQVKELTPVFAFDYLSLEESEFCFNGKQVAARDYAALFRKLKEVSRKTYEELSRDKYFRFHPVDFNDPRVKISQRSFVKAITTNSSHFDADQAPTLYQLDAFKEARIAGFLCEGIFHLIWLDRGHNIYARR